MRAGIAAVLVNLVFNYILIFGKLGAPALGVVGAALATVLSRFVECGIVMIWTHRHRERMPYVRGLYRSLRVPGKLLKQILLLGAPLLLNELLWSGGMTMLNQCYSLRGLEVVSAFNISSTVGNLFFCAFIAMGNAISIMIGRLLGAGELERAVDEDRKLIAFSLALSVAVGLLMAVVAPLIPRLYNTTDAVKALAVKLLLVYAAMMPLYSYTNSCYFTLRSGGKTLITFVFDSLFVWVVCIPVAFVLSHYTSVPILPMYAIVELTNLVKCGIGFAMVRQRKWVVNLVGKK
jgi:putative MATE family efflux protein